MLLTLVSVTGLLRMAAPPAEAAPSCSGWCGVDWTFDPGTGTLTFSGSGSKIEDCEYAGDAPWYSYCTAVRSVVLSDTLFFYKPVLWAVQNGITGGTSANSFGPYDVCTRGQVVTFLYG